MRTEKQQRKGRGSNPRSRANLKEFRPGQSGNPAGRPAGSRDRATVLRRWLDTAAEVVNPESEQVVVGTVEDRVALALIQRGIAGDVPAIREILDSLYGKAARPMEHSFDLSNLSDEELETLERIRVKIA